MFVLKLIVRVNVIVHLVECFIILIIKVEVVVWFVIPKTPHILGGFGIVSLPMNLILD